MSRKIKFPAKKSAARAASQPAPKAKAAAVAAGREPETLGPADVAGMTSSTPASEPDKIKTIARLDPLVDYLRAGPMEPTRLLTQAYGIQEPRDDQVAALVKDVLKDNRFIYLSRGKGDPLMIELAGWMAYKPAPVEASGALKHNATIEEIHAYIRAYKYLDVSVGLVALNVFKSKGLAATKAVLDRIRAEPSLALINVGVDTHVAIRAVSAGGSPSVPQTSEIVPSTPAAGYEAGNDTQVEDNSAPAAKSSTAPSADDIKSVGELADEATKEAAAKAAAGGTVTISVALTPEETERQLVVALKHHHARGRVIGKAFYDMKTEAASLKADLDELNARIKKKAQEMAEHCASEPRADGQQTIPFASPQAESITVGEPPIPVWPYTLPPEQTMAYDAANLQEVMLHNRIREVLPMQEKLHLVTEDVVEVKGSSFLVRQSNHDRSRWFLQPLIGMDDWRTLHEQEFGRAVEGHDQNVEAASQRKLGGEDCGRVVKVRRAKMVLGPERLGLVITTPPTAPVVPPDAKERAAGDAKDDDHAAPGDEPSDDES